MTVLLVLLIIISISSLFIGRYTLSFSDMLRELVHYDGKYGLSTGLAVISNLRLPRIIAVMMVGAGLSVAGCTWICPYISRHLLSLNPLLARCRRYSRGER
ncbi:iron ABC transporter permease [Klebsiella variicola subsp. variicola]|nr:iron ABC transporter permease [Klebsiella variicola subsp. variicola]